MDFDFGSLLAFIIFGVTIGVVYGIVALGISLIYSGSVSYTHLTLPTNREV